MSTSRNNIKTILSQYFFVYYFITYYHVYTLFFAFVLKFFSQSHLQQFVPKKLHINTGSISLGQGSVGPGRNSAYAYEYIIIRV